MQWRKWFLSMLIGAICVSSAAASSSLRKMGSRLPAGLPDPLMFANGAPVTNAQQWAQRREQLLQLLTTQMYGRMPPRPAAMRFDVFDTNRHALGGIATRSQVAILLNGREDGPRIDLLLYVPNQVQRPPVILGMNFWGNETISTDPGIRISKRWVESEKNPWVDLACVKDHRATAACRGINASQWPLKMILARGCAVATFYRGDLDRDRKNQYEYSIRSDYPRLHTGNDDFATIGAWAWGMSRALDYLESDPAVDGQRVVAFGWSRLGKAALWAGATDPRFAAIISNESGAGGAKLFHHLHGQTVAQLNKDFPYWFCRNFHKYSGDDAHLPFDQNEVLALIAPRPLYIASAIGDKQSDPLGEFLDAKAVTPVYRLLGKRGLPAKVWPRVDHPVLGVVSYHVRSGGHGVTDYDWKQYLRFCDRYVKHEKRTAKARSRYK